MEQSKELLALSRRQWVEQSVLRCRDHAVEGFELTATLTGDRHQVASPVLRVDAAPHKVPGHEFGHRLGYVAGIDAARAAQIGLAGHLGVLQRREQPKVIAAVSVSTVTEGVL